MLLAQEYIQFGAMSISVAQLVLYWDVIHLELGLTALFVL